MARLDASQTFDDVKRLILNYVETRIDFGGVAYGRRKFGFLRPME